MPKVEIDCETKSEADLRRVGAVNYAMHPSTELICLSYLIDEPDEPQDLHTWLPGQPMPAELRQVIGAGYHVEAFNVAFEEAIWEHVLVPRHGWCHVTPDQWRDVQAVACYKSMPAALDRLSSALGGPGKDPNGSRLIAKYSKLHNKTAKHDIPPEDLAQFVAYCEDDVAQELGIADFLGDLPEAELERWLRDRRINRRGIYLDREGIANAQSIVDQRAEELVREFRQITGLNPTQRDKVLAWLQEQGVELSDLQATTLEEILAPDEEAEAHEGLDTPQPSLSPTVRRALEIKLAVNKASTKKLDAMTRNCQPDGRARNQTRYHGASTGRATGMGLQPLNFVRNWEDVPPEDLVEAISYRDAEYLDMLYGDAMKAVSKATRHWVCAETGNKQAGVTGNKLMAGDWVSVEAVVMACLAGETWKVEAFRRKEKIYERMAEKIYNLQPGTVTKQTHPSERFDGKTAELAFQFQGALGAWRKFDRSDRHTDEAIVKICKGWRKEHPATVKFWYDLDDAAKHALEFPGSIPEVRGIRFQKEEHWLTMRLLNGKKLYYFAPEFRLRMPPAHKPKEIEACAKGTCSHEPRRVVSYMAVKEGRWQRIYGYGGKWSENAVQAHAREILEACKGEVERVFHEVKPTPIVLCVYDEIVCEVPEDMVSLEKFEKALSYREDWYKDWPISCDAWVGERYRK